MSDTPSVARPSEEHAFGRHDGYRAARSLRQWVLAQLSVEIYREQRLQGLLIGTCVIPFIGALDLLLMSGMSRQRLLIWGTWSAAYFIATPLAWRLPAAAVATLGLLTTSITAAALSALAIGGAGSHSVFFITLVIIPLLVSTTTPDDTLSTVLSGCLTLVGAFVVLRHEGRSPGEIFLWTTMIAISTVIGVTGSIRIRRQQAAKVAAESARAQALEELGEKERRLALADRMVTVGLLASGVAHEVNNPLAFVKSNLHYVQDELAKLQAVGNASELREALKEAQDGVERIGEIVTRLSAFQRDTPEPLTVFSVAESVEAARRKCGEALRGVRSFQLALPIDLPDVRGSFPRLVDVLAELLTNAAAATQSKNPSEGPLIQIAAEATDSQVRIFVDDNGAGIPPGMLPKLFAPFVAGPDQKGPGLSLALCREYLNRMNGTIEGTDRPGGGARFVLEIPRA